MAVLSFTVLCFSIAKKIKVENRKKWLQQEVFRLVVHLSLSPSSETRKKPATEKNWHVRSWGREARLKRDFFSRASCPQDLARPFFFAFIFRISLDGLSERWTTRSLNTPCCNHFSFFLFLFPFEDDVSFFSFFFPFQHDISDCWTPSLVQCVFSF